MEDSIAQTHAGTVAALQKLCSVAHDQEHELSNDLHDEFDKFKVWAGNVGAGHYGKNFKFSLDYRLAEATTFKDQVQTFLKIVSSNAERATLILAKTPSELDTWAASIEDAESSSDEGDDSPLEISSGSENEERRPTDRFTEQNHPPETRSSPHRATFSEQNILLERLVAIRTTISCLYKLPIRQPASFDRLKDKSTVAASHFHFYDASYVRDKFPLLDQDVAARLANMITRRRQLIEYRRTHQHRMTSGFPPELNVPPCPASKPQERLSTAMSQEDDHRTVTSFSKATKFEHTFSTEISRLVAPSVATSEAQTSVVASEVTKELKIEVPPRPRNEKNGSSRTNFDCPYCCLAVTVTSEREWKKHVLADMQPYVCTHKICSLTDHMFESREAWYTHEMQVHRVIFSCGDESHPTFSQQPSFEAHMDHVHNIQVSKSHELLYNFRRPEQSRGGTCNLCFQPTTSLKRHVARHLEQVALFAIPRAEYDTDGEVLKDDKSISGNNTKGSHSEMPQNPTNSSEASEHDQALSAAGPSNNDISSGESQEEPYHSDALDIQEPFSEPVSGYHHEVSTNHAPNDSDDEKSGFIDDFSNDAYSVHSEVQYDLFAGESEQPSTIPPPAIRVYHAPNDMASWLHSTYEEDIRRNAIGEFSSWDGENPTSDLPMPSPSLDPNENQRFENDLSCPDCPTKSFDSRDDLIRHRSYHSHKKHSCECGASFVHPKDLRRHRKTHTEPTVLCPVQGCSSRFKAGRRDNMKRHIRNQHPGVDLDDF